MHKCIRSLISYWQQQKHNKKHVILTPSHFCEETKFLAIAGESKKIHDKHLTLPLDKPLTRGLDIQENDTHTKDSTHSTSNQVSYNQIGESKSNKKSIQSLRDFLKSENKGNFKIDNKDLLQKAMVEPLNLSKTVVNNTNQSQEKLSLSKMLSNMDLKDTKLDSLNSESKIEELSESQSEGNESPIQNNENSLEIQGKTTFIKDNLNSIKGYLRFKFYNG